MPEIKIPYRPRPLQLKAHNRKERFALLSCHRRFGKTVFAMNELIRASATCSSKNPRFAYLAPLYRQAKAVAWDMLKHYSRPIPGMKYNEAQLRADFPNGARISLHGGDNPDHLRGLGFDGVVMDEYGQMSSRLWAEVVRPSLVDRKGWGVFIGTPKGYNSFYDLYEAAKKDSDWYVAIHRASETGYVNQDELDAAKKQMSEEQYNQEFECSWTAAIKGSYYGGIIEDADKEGRICRVEHDPAIPVHVAWDLGISDSCALWFFQVTLGEVRIIDYYEHNNVGLEHYVKIMEEKGYWYGDDWLPHDAKVRELGTGRTRAETLINMGRRPRIVPNHKIADGINAGILLLQHCYFD